MLLLFLIRLLKDHMFGKELFIRFTVCVFHGRLSNFVCVMWVVIVLIPDHCLSIYFSFLMIRVKCPSFTTTTTTTIIKKGHT